MAMMSKNMVNVTSIVTLSTTTATTTTLPGRHYLYHRYHCVIIHDQQEHLRRHCHRHQHSLR